MTRACLCCKSRPQLPLPTACPSPRCALCSLPPPRAPPPPPPPPPHTHTHTPTHPHVPPSPHSPASPCRFHVQRFFAVLPPEQLGRYSPERNPDVPFSQNIAAGKLPFADPSLHFHNIQVRRWAGLGAALAWGRLCCALGGGGCGRLQAHEEGRHSMHAHAAGRAPGNATPDARLCCPPVPAGGRAARHLPVDRLPLPRFPRKHGALGRGAAPRLLGAGGGRVGAAPAAGVGQRLECNGRRRRRRRRRQRGRRQRCRRQQRQRGQRRQQQRGQQRRRRRRPQRGRCCAVGGHFPQPATRTGQGGWRGGAAGGWGFGGRAASLGQGVDACKL